MLQTGYPLGRTSAVSGYGVIVRWKIRISTIISAADATTNLRVIGPATSPLQWGAAGPPIDVPDLVALPAVISQDLRIPISPGQSIAAQFQTLAGGNVLVSTRPVPGAATGIVNSAPPAGSTADPTVGNDNRLLAIGADVEPDADRDGFGDETQDRCPTDPSTQGACPDVSPPETSISKAPKAKGTKRKAKFTFVSTEPGSTFACELDGRETPCADRFAKKVRPGKHHLGVSAIDASGNRDLTPATYDWKLKRRKK